MLRPLLVAALLVVALHAVPTVAAQEATPAATPAVMTGVTIEPLGLVEVAPGFAVPVTRVELAPGTGLAPHTSPVPVVAQVESGDVNFAIIRGVARQARLTIVPAATPVAATPMPGAATPAADMPAPDTMESFAVIEEEIRVLGDEISLAAGEGVAFNPDVVHTFRNVGTEPAVILIVGDIPPDQPIFEFVEGSAAATPEA